MVDLMVRREARAKVRYGRAMQGTVVHRVRRVWVSIPKSQFADCRWRYPHGGLRAEWMCRNTTNSPQLLSEGPVTCAACLAKK